MSVTIHTHKLIPFIKNKEKLYAIKMLKDDTGFPLKICKEIIDDLEIQLQDSDIPEYLEIDVQEEEIVPTNDTSAIPDSGPIERYDNTTSKTKLLITFIILILGIIIGFFITK